MKCQPTGADGAIALLANNDLRNPLIRGVLVVDLIAVDEHHDVGILFNGTGFAEIRIHGALVGSLFQCTIQLRKRHNRTAKFLCYGFQVLAQALGGRVDKTGKREYGATDLKLSSGGTLLASQPELQVCWMSHGDQVMEAPSGFEVLASTATTPVAAFENLDRRIFGVQWHPEVKHSEQGQQVLKNFLYEGAGIEPSWNSGNVIAEQVEKIRAQVGSARVICGLSGGVDSAVAAALVHRAVGDQLTA
ncbi:MAG: hypothetical protein EBY45_09440, partial [Gammaproteobacteria bacterium]|nr:hypothetical protein [Gammaproteobacteria bacterium]